MPLGMGPGRHVVGVDIGGTNVVAGVLDHGFGVVRRAKRKTHGKDRSKPAEEQLARTIEEALEGIDRESVLGIGIGSPGPLDPVTGEIHDTPNLAWKQFPLADFVSKEFGVPAAVDNDVNLGTLGEWFFGGLDRFRHVLGIFPGTGIGGGIIIDGKVLHGKSGSAAEIGHMTMMRDGPFCGCGKRGCLEALASRTAIAAELAALAARHDAPYILENCGTDVNNIRSGAMAKAIAAGDTMVEAVVRRAAYWVGVAVGNLVNTLSPEAVVLGGGLVEAMPELYLDEVRRGMLEHAMPFISEGVQLTAAKLGDDAVMMGAARMIADRLG